MAVAHLALDLRARNERRHGVHNDNIDGVGAHERLGDLERLFAGIRLRNEQRIYVYAERGRIDRVKCVLHVDKRRVAAHFLAFGDAVERQGGLTGGFRPVDLNDSAARQTADTERESSEREPVEIASTCMPLFWPRRITAPSPNCFLICVNAVSSALRLSSGLMSSTFLLTGFYFPSPWLYPHFF